MSRAQKRMQTASLEPGCFNFGIPFRESETKYLGREFKRSPCLSQSARPRESIECGSTLDIGSSARVSMRPFFDLFERIFHLYVVSGATRRFLWIAFLRRKSRQELPCHWASGFLSESNGSGRTKTSEFEPSHSQLCLEQLLYSRYRWRRCHWSAFS
jgi:hypothetical protein